MGAKQHELVQPPKIRNWVPLAKAPVIADMMGGGCCPLSAWVMLTWDQEEEEEAAAARGSRGSRRCIA